jgi:hypothetical protein
MTDLRFATVSSRLMSTCGFRIRFAAVGKYRDRRNMMEHGKKTKHGDGCFKIFKLWHFLAKGNT